MQLLLCFGVFGRFLCDQPEQMCRPISTDREYVGIKSLRNVPKRSIDAEVERGKNVGDKG